MIFVQAFNLQKAEQEMADALVPLEDDDTNVVLYAENPIGEDEEGRAYRNFRKLVNPDYKKGRASKPRGLNLLKQHYCNIYTVYYPEWYLETDDMIAYDYTMAKAHGYSCSIVGIDKDYKQIADVYPYFGDQNGLGYDPQFVHRQLLMGDSSDGIKGVHKVGAVKAQKFLESCTDLDRPSMEAQMRSQFCKDNVEFHQMIKDYICLKLLTVENRLFGSWIEYRAFGYEIYVNIETGEIKIYLGGNEYALCT
jgi:hypothetical protein